MKTCGGPPRQSVQILGVGFTWEACDHVGCRYGTVERGSHAIDHLQKIIARVLAVHSPKEVIGAALQRQMKMRDDLLMRAKAIRN